MARQKSGFNEPIKRRWWLPGKIYSLPRSTFWNLGNGDQDAMQASDDRWFMKQDCQVCMATTHMHKPSRYGPEMPLCSRSPSDVPAPQKTWRIEDSVQTPQYWEGAEVDYKSSRQLTTTSKCCTVTCTCIPSFHIQVQSAEILFDLRRPYERFMTRGILTGSRANDIPTCGKERIQIAKRWNKKASVSGLQ